MSAGVNSYPLEELGPTELNRSAVVGQFLDIEPDKLTVRYTKDAKHSSDVGAVQANRPVANKRLVYYFEMTVADQGEASRIGIGFSDRNFKLTKQPGWDQNSYGYHGDDGRKFHNSGKGEDYGPVFGTGDTVGAGILFSKQEIFFTKNGTKLKVAFRNVKGILYPTVGLHSKNERVEVNFGQKPFKFDLEGFITEERERVQQQVQNIPVSPGLTHQVIRRYLLHYGYADTLAAFDEAAGMGGDVVHPDIPEATDVAARKSLRQKILSGDVDGALQLLQASYPGILQDQVSYFEVLFYLNCQKYIELVRNRQPEQAVLFAQQHLAPMKLGAGQFESTLQDVVALIAYETPEESSLQHLLSISQREQVADVVNAAVLALVAGSPKKPVSVLERLLSQLVTVHAVLHEENDSQGEVFNLQDHLH